QKLNASARPSRADKTENEQAKNLPPPSMHSPTLRIVFFFTLLALAAANASAASSPVASPVASDAAPKPLFRDPIHDGAADPVVIWNPHAQRWWMFYTNRRANIPGLSG